jgi:hypothetical protein
LQYLFLKGMSEAKPSFDIRYSIFCGSLFNPAAKTASLIIKEPCHFGVVLYKCRRWP